MRKQLFFLSAFLLVSILVLRFTTRDEAIPEPASSSEDQLEDITQVRSTFGFDEQNYTILHDTIRQNQFVGDILSQYLDFPSIDRLLTNSKDHFDPRYIRVGRPYHVVSRKDSTSSGVAFIYEHDPIRYTVLHLEDSLYASTGEKEIETREAMAEGIIESSLYLTLTDQGLSQNLALEMADIYAWSIDFYRLQKGDRFKVLYEEQFIEDEFIGIGEVKACVFTHKDLEFRAYAYNQNGKRDYFDEEGEGLRKAFLKSPLKFGRMTSGYSNRRFHPVQRRFKAHRGTDYAAPRGTPILATGDGEVIKSSYTRNNGNFVKIRHNSTYTTQYLHMSKRAVERGQQVVQGEVIGYVGSTGLATGPHVCYRFWKNGKQVDHRREEFPSSDPILPENMDSFQQVRDSLDQQLSLGPEVVALIP
ncbi:MAG: peptidoglycan DD-metalloendopeptidase family protein [Flavobacteriales bacterium]|nr:peptidoglycan DD-metalloendopeptidase family protein [Flavobacteriales bacterium]